MKNILSFLFISLLSLGVNAQKVKVSYDHLTVELDTATNFIKGINEIHVETDPIITELKLKLYPQLTVDSVLINSSKTTFERDSQSIILPISSNKNTISIYYHGEVLEAVNPPWEGGFVHKKDSLGRRWKSVACQGIGAQVWWPFFEELNIEPAKMDLTFITPKGMDCISNGTLVSKKNLGEKIQWNYSVKNSINSYNPTFYLGNYTVFDTTYVSDNQNLKVQIALLDYHSEKFDYMVDQVFKILEAYEYYLGAFPFPEEGYKIVEAPYWGMEHQSAIAYGDDFKLNKFWFDFIAVHESGHEYFGNSLSCTDNGELWLHESFTTYLESLYLEYHFGKRISMNYLNHQKTKIENNYPLQGKLGVNYEHPDTDIYYKGAWMLHSIRNLVANDSIFFKAFRDFYDRYKLGFVTTAQAVEYWQPFISTESANFFEQFLHQSSPPKLVYSVKKNTITLKWNAVEGFKMPVWIKNGIESEKYNVSTKTQSFQLKKTKNIQFDMDKAYFILN